MSSPSHYAVDTVARPTAAVMKPRGEGMLVSTRSLQPSRFGSKAARVVRGSVRH